MKRRFLAVLLAVVMLITSTPVGPLKVSAAAMSVSQDFLNVLKKMEGFSPIPYKDYSQYSIGYGSFCANLDDKATVDYYTQNPITEAQAEQMLLEQLGSYVDSVNSFAATHALTLKQHQFDALVSFTYNCGAAWTTELTGFFNAAVRDGDLGNALIYGMCLYSTAGGQYILVGRRMAEANMYINGVYRAYNETDPYPSSFRHVFLEGGAGKVRYKICGFNGDLAEPINVSFSQIPTGKDGNGNAFAYTLAGWYTASGRKVDKLDNTLTPGETLYAKWADPQGNIVTPPDQSPPESSFPKQGTVNGTGVNVRTGPGTGNPSVGKKNTGDRVTVYEEQVGGSFTWGRIGDNQWIALTYVTYDDNVVTDIRLLQNPTKTEYIQPIATVDPAGSVLLVTYANGYTQAMTAHRTMLSGFDGKRTGTQTVTVSYGGKTTSFQVTVRSAVPDSITSSKYRIEGNYIYGVQPGTTAAQLLEGLNERKYIKLYSVAGELSGDDPVGTDTMAMLLDGEEPKAACSVIIRGDVTGDGAIDGTDATLLLQQQAGWEVFVTEAAADVNGDGVADGNDVTLLLQYAAGWNVTINQ